MRNAVRFSRRVTVGGVPTAEDLQQLKVLGYQTLIDLREESERFGGQVAERARSMGFNSLDLPISRDHVDVEQALSFYELVYSGAAPPIYAFSRFGKKPLTFLLLLEAVARDQPLGYIYRRAARFGLPLEGDLALQAFVVGLINSGDTAPLREVVERLQPELSLEPARASRTLPAEVVQEALEQATRTWISLGDPEVLRSRLLQILSMLDAG